MVLPFLRYVSGSVNRVASSTFESVKIFRVLHFGFLFVSPLDWSFLSFPCWQPKPAAYFQANNLRALFVLLAQLLPVKSEGGGEVPAINFSSLPALSRKAPAELPQ